MRRPMVYAVAAAMLLTIAAAPIHSQPHSIFGSIGLEGSDDWSGVTVWVDSLHIAQTNSYGSYQIDGLANGTYTVRAWKENCLASIIGTVMISGQNVSGVSGMLFAGDLFGDGRINLHDTRVLLDHFMETPDSSGWDERLDIETDDVIDSLDVALLASRWRETASSGLPFWDIEVTEPNSSTIWNTGQEDLPIRWMTGNLGGNVTIDLYRYGLKGDTLVGTTENDGEYILPALPGGLLEGDGYQVRVFMDESHQDRSESFSIENTMYVILPNHETTWWAGELDVSIEWNPGLGTGDVSIYLLMDEAVVDTIAEMTGNDGLFEDYDVPASLASYGGYRIEITDQAGYSIRSDYFATRHALVITNPDSSDVWWLGGYAGINWWNRAGLTSTVSLYLYKGDEPRYAIVEGRQYDLEFYDWTVPGDTEPGSDYRVMARYDDSPELHNFSEYFNIRPRFVVTKPHSYTQWYAGQQGIAVEWRDSGIGGSVTISLYRGSLQQEVIALETENDGSYANFYYTLHPLQEEGTNYRVLVYHDDKYQDYSDYFTIYRPADPDEYGWKSISPGTALWDVSLGGAPFATTVGSWGRIIRTEDGGDTWVEQESGTYHHLYGIAFTDALSGTAVGLDGLVLSTTDGGTNWGRQNPDITKTLFDVSQIDGSTAIAVGEGGMIIRTVDGGTSWERLSSGVPDNLNAVCFIDADNGWAAGHPERMIKTSDGGDTWTIVDSGYDGWPITDVRFHDALNGAAIGHIDENEYYSRQHILMTSDGGMTWEEKHFYNDPGGNAVLDFADAMTLTAASGSMIRTTDGGETWTGQSSYMFQLLYGIEYATGGIGMAVGSAGEIMRTADLGATWSAAGAVTQDLMDVEFIDFNVAVAVGYDGVILKTINGGESWIQRSAGIGRTLLMSVSFAGADTGMVAGDGGTILSTVDGGTAWTALESGISTRLVGVDLIDGMAACAVGEEGVILITTDGGASWTSAASGSNASLRGVSFAGADYGTVAGSSGTILRTSNGGVTWLPQNSGTSVYLNDVELIDALNGIAAGDSGTILRTSDGGETWEPLSSGTTLTLLSISIPGPDIITVAGYGGTILRSDNRGDTWTVQPCGTTKTLRSVSFSSPQNGIIVGNFGTILRTTTGGQ